MSVYPNYYQNPQTNQPNMAAYQNFNQPMQIGNPYIDRMAQLQQYQQSLQMQPTQMSTTSQPQGIIGKVVGDFSEITANDVPMNGTSAVFPKNDMSEIQIRTWGADGKIQTISYKPILEQNQAEAMNMPQMDFNALNEDVKALRMEIAERFDRLEKSWGNSEANRTNFKPVNNQSNYRNNAKPKKTEVVADE